MDIRVRAEGRSFARGSDIDSTIDLLKGYGDVFKSCLDRSAIEAGARQLPFIRISVINPGSIDIRLVTEIAAAVSPLWPQIFDKAWDIYKAVFDLISIANRHMKKEGRPMNIHIQDSPGAVVNIVNGDQVETSRDVFDLAVKHHGMFARLAALVQKGKADEVLIEADVDQPRRSVIFDSSNKNDFELPSTETKDETPVTLDCGIYRFNKHNQRGYVEYLEKNEPQKRPFTLRDGLFDECIKAFAHETVKISALRTMEVNALGESKIKELHIIGFEFPAA